MHVGVLATNSIMHVHFARVPVMVGILAAGGMVRAGEIGVPRARGLTSPDAA